MENCLENCLLLCSTEERHRFTTHKSEFPFASELVLELFLSLGKKMCSLPDVAKGRNNKRLSDMGHCRETPSNV